MNPGRLQPGDDDLKEPKRKKVKPGVILKNPYPIIFWNKVGIPPCTDLWPAYCGIFDGESVIVEYPEDMSDIYSMGYFGKRMLYHRGHEPSIRELPVLRERQWKRRVEWAAEFGYVFIPPEQVQEGNPSCSGSQQHKTDAASPSVEKDVEKDDECDSAASETAEISKVSDGGDEDGNGKEEKEQKMEFLSDVSDKSESDCAVIAQDERSTSGDCVRNPEDSSAECCLVDESSVSEAANSGQVHMSDGEAEKSIKKSVESKSVENGSKKVKVFGIEGETKEGEERRLEEEASAAHSESIAGEMNKQDDKRGSVGGEQNDNSISGLEGRDVKENHSESADGKEIDGSNKEVCRDDNQEDVDGGETESGDATEKTIEKKVTDKGKDNEEQFRNGTEEGKEAPSKYCASNEGEKVAEENNIKEKEDKEDVEIVERSDSEENPKLREMEENCKCDEEVDIVEKEVNRKASTGSQEKKSATCDIQVENDEREDHENTPNMNDSGTSVEIIEEGRKNATPEKFSRSGDKNVKGKVRKRSLQGAVLEVDICDDRETDERRGKRAKKMGSVEREDAGESEEGNSDKESSGESCAKTLRETEGECEKNRMLLGEEKLNDGIDCEIVEIEGEGTSALLQGKRKEERCLDSDDDIMEVSMEETRNHPTKRDAQNTNRSERFLNEIRKKLPSDVELLQLSDVKSPKKIDGSKSSESKKICKETPEENDDDVIEIDLQKNEMLELEGTDEDDSMECEYFDHRADVQKMRRRRSNLRQRGKVTDRISDDEIKSVEMEEMEDKQSLLSNVKLESECDVSPCIVLPDSDLEDENSELEKTPRLESDPSVYLPSLDVLRLLPEEAFFLAYGLGCMEVWDGRKTDAEEGIAKRGNVKQEEDSKKQLKQGDSLTESSPSNSSTKFKKENLIKASNSSENSLSESDHMKSEKLDSEGPKSGSVLSQIKDGFKISVDEVDESLHLPSCSEVPVSLPCNSNDVKKNNDSEASKKNVSNDESEKGRNLEQFIKTPDGKNQVDGPSDNSSADTDAHKPSKSILKSKSSQEIDTFTISDSKQKNSTDSCHEKENGFITVIDLADSPPSRQWGDREGWSASEKDDDVNVDCPKMSDSRVVKSEQMPESTLNCGHDDAMSLKDLWNAFRLSRSSTSPSATPFETSYAVYHHFRTKRWVVKPGIRFGGDFLLYKDGPSFYHASYLVIIDSSDEKSRLSWNALAGMNRLAENVAKDLMICRVEWPESLTETQLQSPKCLSGLTVEEILVRRWVSVKERDAHEEVFDDAKDCDFIPLEL